MILAQSGVNRMKWAHGGTGTRDEANFSLTE